MVDKFCIACGPSLMEVSCNDPELTQQLLRHYARFIANGNANFTVLIEAYPGTEGSLGKVSFTEHSLLLNGDGYRGEINLETFSGKLGLTLRDPFYGADYFLRVAAAILNYIKGGLMIHGAAIKKEENGFLFVGKSGIGKTTVARYSDSFEVLNDDLVFLHFHENGWMIYASPFYNPTQVSPQPIQAPLKAIYFLVQDKKVYLEAINQSTAVAALLANIPVLVTNPLMLNEIFSRCVRIIEKTTYANLHFLPDASFWKVIR